MQGEIFGYLGPNGAGKTTTIRLLLDLIRPSQGRATILGLDAQADSVELHKRIGFLPGELALWKNLRGQEVVNFVGKVRGGVDAAYVRQLSERLELDLSLKVRSYSTGNRRKLGLVLALMNKAELLILDEPTAGLDPLMQQIFNELMREVRNEGRTVFLSSHVLSEVQAICDRVGILRTGDLKTVERVSDLTHADFRWVTLELRDGVQLATKLEALAGVSQVSSEDGKLKLRLTGDFDPLLRALGDAYVVDLRVHEPSLEEIFLAFYGNNSDKELAQ
jgi:ABC-2 type transport system ATP-binding protein